jgi:hypothetical protein
VKSAVPNLVSRVKVLSTPPRATADFAQNFSLKIVPAPLQSIPADPKILFLCYFLCRPLSRAKKNICAGPSAPVSSTKSPATLGLERNRKDTRKVVLKNVIEVRNLSQRGETIRIRKPSSTQVTALNSVSSFGVDAQQRKSEDQEAELV